MYIIRVWIVFDSEKQLTAQIPSKLRNTIFEWNLYDNFIKHIQPKGLFRNIIFWGLQ